MSRIEMSIAASLCSYIIHNCSHVRSVGQTPGGTGPAARLAANGLLEVLCDPKRKQHKGMIKWVGRKFDSEASSLDAVNQALEGAG